MELAQKGINLAESTLVQGDQPQLTFKIGASQTVSYAPLSRDVAIKRVSFKVPGYCDHYSMPFELYPSGGATFSYGLLEHCIARRARDIESRKPNPKRVQLPLPAVIDYAFREKSKAVFHLYHLVFIHTLAFGEDDNMSPVYTLKGIYFQKALTSEEMKILEKYPDLWTRRLGPAIGGFPEEASDDLLTALWSIPSDEIPNSGGK